MHVSAGYGVGRGMARPDEDCFSNSLPPAQDID
jgi:hypothetical protein